MSKIENLNRTESKMNRIAVVALTLMLPAFLGWGQEAGRLSAPDQAKISSISPSAEMTAEAQGFFDPAVASQAGQWNPTITEVHKPLPSQPNEDEEYRIKTQEELEKIPSLTKKDIQTLLKYQQHEC